MSGFNCFSSRHSFFLFFKWLRLLFRKNINEEFCGWHVNLCWAYCIIFLSSRPQIRLFSRDFFSPKLELCDEVLNVKSLFSSPWQWQIIEFIYFDLKFHRRCASTIPGSEKLKVNVKNVSVSNEIHRRINYWIPIFLFVCAHTPPRNNHLICLIRSFTMTFSVLLFWACNRFCKLPKCLRTKWS